MEKSVSDRIRVLGFFMTCVVVVFHCWTMDQGSAVHNLDVMANKALDRSVEGMLILAMSYFFTVSGYLLFQNFSLPAYGPKMKRRVFSLLIPYTLWQCLKALWDIFIRGEEVIPETFLKTTFLLQKWAEIGALWYVYAIFLLALLSPLFYCLLKNRYSGWCLILLVAFFVEIRAYFDHGWVARILHYGCMGSVIRYLPCYMIGCYFGMHNGGESDPKSLKLLLPILLMAVLMQKVKLGFQSELVTKALPVMLLYLLPIPSCLRGKGIYSASFLIYALHQPVMEEIWEPCHNWLLSFGTMPVALHNLLIRILILAASIAAAVLMQALLRKLSPRILELLSGGRAV